MFVVRSASPFRDNAIGCALLFTVACGGEAEGIRDRGNGGTGTLTAAVGGARGTGVASAGDAPTGGGSGGAAGTGGGTSGTNACAKVAYDHCVTECLEELVLIDNAICANGAWTCRSGYVLASSCPKQACGVTPDACCDRTTGIVTRNPCNPDGSREVCPDGGTETYMSQPWCIPSTLAIGACISLDGQPCSGPAVGCADMSAALTRCACNGAALGTTARTWTCSVYIGP